MYKFNFVIPSIVPFLLKMLHKDRLQISEFIVSETIDLDSGKTCIYQQFGAIGGDVLKNIFPR
jgi:hypothetical protein